MGIALIANCSPVRREYVLHRDAVLVHLLLDIVLHRVTVGRRDVNKTLISFDFVCLDRSIAKAFKRSRRD